MFFFYFFEYRVSYYKLRLLKEMSMEEASQHKITMNFQWGLFIRNWRILLTQVTELWTDFKVCGRNCVVVIVSFHNCAAPIFQLRLRHNRNSSGILWTLFILHLILSYIKVVYTRKRNGCLYYSLFYQEIILRTWFETKKRAKIHLSKKNLWQ